MVLATIFGVIEAQWAKFGPDGVARSFAFPPDVFDALVREFDVSMSVADRRTGTQSDELRIASSFGDLVVTTRR